MASAVCGGQSVLLRPASDDDALREQEAYRYYQPLKDLLQFDERHLLPAETKARSSPERSLNAFVQLAALRLNVRHAFVSLIDRKYQYILAEGVQDPALANPRNTLWLGTSRFERLNTPCELAAGLLVPSDVAAATIVKEGDVLVIPDMSKHEAFAAHGLVTSEPNSRFYAGVPIVSPNGYNIGVFCAMDDSPRSGLSPSETEFMQEMAVTVMSHLEMVRAQAELVRSQAMVFGLGSFVDGKASLKDWWDHVSSNHSNHRRPRTHRAQKGGRPQSRSSAANVVNRTREGLPKAASSASSTSKPHIISGQSIGMADTRRDSSQFASPSKSALQDQSESANELQEGSISTDVRGTFQRAAEIIRESVDVDGAVFLDASVGTFAGLVDGIEQHKLSRRASSSTVSSVSAVPAKAPMSVDDKPCIQFGSSLSETQSSLSIAMHERFLHTLLARYPKGRVWNFTEAEDNTDELNGIPDFTPRIRDTVVRRGKRWRERRRLRQLFPGARSLGLVGMWDSHRSRWFAGSIIWTCSPTRILSPDNELNYMVAFGQSIMAEIARIDVKMADRAKATFISSISHELRTPLHGIMGSSECLQSTNLDAFQSGLISTIETCGKTLLDTFDNLLSFAKINNLTRSSNYRRPSVATVNSDSSRNAVDAVQAPVDLSVLVEEVIDTAFAGNEFVRVTPIRSGLATGGVVPSELRGDPLRALASLDVVFDYDTSKNWTFMSQAGGWIRVVMNLVGNSLKYTESGSVTVRLDAEDLLEAEEDEDVQVVLTVSDTGKGMTEEFLRTGVFSPFVQEDPLSPGTGLGLSIVRQITTQLGGTISVQSKKGQGTQIQIVVPMARAGTLSAPHKPSLVPTVTDNLHRKRVNLVCHNEEQKGAALLEGVCKKWFGVELSRSVEPLEADLYIFTKKQAETWATYLAAKPSYPNILATKPVIVCCEGFASAHALKSSNSLASINCCVEYLSQPLAPNKFAKTLEQCLERIADCDVMGPDGSAHGSRSGSPAPRGLLRRPRSCRTCSNLSITSKESNPEVVPYTPSEEVGQEALMSQYRQATEADIAEKKLASTRLTQRIEVEKPLLQSPTSATANVMKPSSSAPSVSVLIVDDNNVNANLLATFMKRQNHAYDTAINGLEALQLYQIASDPTHTPRNNSVSSTTTETHNIQKSTPTPITRPQPSLLRASAYDYILMDINMPVMDGLESTRRIRAFERSKGLRPATIVALTGMASSEAQNEAFGSGVDLFLTKPVRLKELLKILEGKRDGERS